MLVMYKVYMVWNWTHSSRTKHIWCGIKFKVFPIKLKHPKYCKTYSFPRDTTGAITYFWDDKADGTVNSTEFHETPHDALPDKQHEPIPTRNRSVQQNGTYMNLQNETTDCCLTIISQEFKINTYNSSHTTHKITWNFKPNMIYCI
jgi:hypothetical protein